MSLKKKEQFWDACALGVEVESTGFCGGDAGHGGRSTVILRDLAGYCGSVIVNGAHQDGFQSLEFEALGDAELRTLADALSWAAEQLRAAMRTERELSEEEIKQMEEMDSPTHDPTKTPDFDASKM